MLSAHKVLAVLGRPWPQTMEARSGIMGLSPIKRAPGATSTGRRLQLENIDVHRSTSAVDPEWIGMHPP